MEAGKLNWNLSVSDLYELSELYMREKRQVFNTISKVAANEASFSNTLGVMIIHMINQFHLYIVSRRAGEV